MRYGYPRLAALFAVAATVATTSGPAMAAVYTLEDGGSAMFGREERVTTVHEDTLYDIARRFGLTDQGRVRSKSVARSLPQSTKIVRSTTDGWRRSSATVVRQEE